jgi:gliding motility-associated-like protein
VGNDTIKVVAVRPGYQTTPACKGETVTFEDTSGSYFSSAVAWHWMFNNSITDTSDAQDPTQFYDSTGYYSVKLIVTDGYGCMDSLSDSVLIHGLPTITASGDTTVCVGDAAQISGGGGVSYSWSPSGSVSCSNCQTTNASPTVPTVYTVTGTDVYGCTNTDSVDVKLKTTTTAVTGANTAVCLGDSVVITDSGAQTYTWYPATGISNDHSGTPSVSPTGTTTYMVIARDGSCIPDTGYITVVVHPLPTVNAGADQQIVAGQSTVLHATASGAVKYSWTPDGSLDCDSCLDPTATPIGTTTYLLTGYTDYGCADSSSTTVHVVCDNSQVFIPNTFTPNGDGQNDVFYPRGTGISKINSFRIYNRWGEVLFERTNIDINDAANGWDGSYKGGSPRPDVYVYIVDAICNTGEPMTLKGDVTIIR